MADDKEQGTIEKRIRVIIVEQLGLEENENEMTRGASLINDLGADSLDLVEVVMALEEEFDIEIPDQDAENIETFGQAVAYIQQRLAEENI